MGEDGQIDGKTKLERAGLRDEFELNPKTEDMCLFTAKYFEGCKKCPRTPEAVAFCKLEKIHYEIIKILKAIQER